MPHPPSPPLGTTSPPWFRFPGRTARGEWSWRSPCLGSGFDPPPPYLPQGMRANSTPGGPISAPGPGRPTRHPEPAAARVIKGRLLVKTGSAGCGQPPSRLAPPALGPRPGSGRRPVRRLTPVAVGCGTAGPARGRGKGAAETLTTQGLASVSCPGDINSAGPSLAPLFQSAAPLHRRHALHRQAVQVRSAPRMRPPPASSGRSEGVAGGARIGEPARTAIPIRSTAPPVPSYRGHSPSAHRWRRPHRACPCRDKGEGRGELGDRDPV